MKQFFFRNVAVTCGNLIYVNTSIGNVIVGVIGGVFGVVNWILAWTSRNLLLAIDKDRYEHAASTMEQRDDLIELELLKAVSQVKEDAISGRVWTSSHTLALNKIGSALHMQCGWEPARIHGYLRQVVESIPGMSYYGGDDFDS